MFGIAIEIAHTVSQSQDSNTSSTLQSSFLLVGILGACSNRAPPTSAKDTAGVPGSPSWLGPATAVAGIGGVNQQMLISVRLLFLSYSCVCVFPSLSNKYFLKIKNEYYIKKLNKATNEHFI